MVRFSRYSGLKNCCKIKLKNVVDIDDFYWNSLEHYVIEWYPAVLEENKRLSK
jgi:hypothetical protein